jgi:large subunit ribosomal protein L17
MRHGKKDNHLGRTHSHREAMLSNMASSLILKKRIETTVAKAKELRKFVEPLLTKAKDDTHQNRRIVFQTLTSKETIKELFGPVADKIANRPGGYTRIIKLGNRAGDNAETCLIELVDFNETLLAAAQEKATTRTRRSRRGGSRQGTDAVVADAPYAEVVADEPAAPAAEAATGTEEAPAAEVSTDETPAAEGETPAEGSNDEPKQA